MKIFANGTEVYSAPHAHGGNVISGNTGRNIAIGNQPTGAGERPFDGYIDDVRIYNRPLLENEIQRMYSAGAPATACTAPDAETGTMLYNRSEGVMQYCNGSRWVSMGPRTAQGGAGGDAALSPPAPGNGLVGYWPLDSDATDAAGSNDGTPLGGASITSNGKIGGAMSFDGTDDQIDIGNPANLNFGTTSSFTLSAWIRPDTVSALRRVLSKGHWNWQDGGYAIFLHNGRIYSGLSSSSASSSQTTSVLGQTGVLIQTNSWQHVTVTFDQTAKLMSIFINGEPVPLSRWGTTCGSYSGTVLDYSACNLASATTAASLRIGATHTNNEFFDGLIDDVRVYNRALDEDEVSALYKSSSLVGHWTLDETTGTVAADSSGNGNNGTVSGTNFSTSSVAGLNSRAMNFDGSNDEINVGNGASISFGGRSPFTISAWIYMDTVEYGNIFSKYGTTEANRQFAMYINPASLPVCLRQVAPHNVPGTTTLMANNWYHIACRYDGTTLRTYVNGVQENSIALGATNSAATTVFIGSNANTGDANRWFNGIIDDVRAYSRALSTQEIEQLYFATGGGNTVPITGCSAVGQTCDDETIYAGETGDAIMYTTPCNLGQTWNGASCTGSASGNYWNEHWSLINYTQTFITDDDDGYANTYALIEMDSDNAAGVQIHYAAQQCADLSLFGHSDWYLPAINELSTLYDNEGIIGNFEPLFYWSSTEVGTSAAERIDFSSGGADAATKNGGYRVRCVRRGDKQLETAFCASPRGVAGQMFYNDDHNVMQWCNGQEWVATTDTLPGSMPPP